MPENTEPHDRRNHLAKREDHITWQLEKYGQMYAELETRLKDLELQRLKDPGPSNDEARDFVIEQMGKALEGQRRLLTELQELIDSRSQEIDRIEERYTSYFDRIYDFEKHITTLSTAAIVGTGALVQIFGFDPELREVIGTGLACFVLAIVAAIVGMFGDILDD